MRKIFTVLRFEFKTYAFSKAFIISTIFILILAFAGPQVPNLINLFQGITSETTIAVYDTTGRFDENILSGFLEHRAIIFTNIDDAIDSVNEGENSFAVELGDESYRLFVTTIGIGVMQLESQLNSLFRYFYQRDRFYELGVSPVDTQAIFGFTPVAEVLMLGPGGEIDEGAVADTFLENFIYSYVMAFVLYFALLSGGAHLLTTVVREKSTKTMELLVTSCKTTYMLVGKVLGVSLAILSQVLLLVLAAGASMLLTGFMELEGLIGEAVFVVSIDAWILGMLVLFFLMGFIMYAFLYAALASTVSRMEDANSIASFPMTLIMVGFLGSIIGGSNPGADIVVVMSHIPFFAPFMMFMRISMGVAQSWEVILSIVTQFLTIGLIAFLGAKIYRMGTLMYGMKPKLKDLLAAFK